MRELQEATVEIREVPSVQVVLVYENNGEKYFLLGKRVAGGFHNQWAFPGGKLDPGESDLIAACRELKEEIGKTIDPNHLKLLRETESQILREKDGELVQYRYKIKVFMIEVENQTFENTSPGEHSEFSWLTLAGALALHQQALKEHEDHATTTVDKIPGAIAPKTLETLQMLAENEEPAF